MLTNLRMGALVTGWALAALALFAVFQREHEKKHAAQAASALVEAPATSQAVRSPLIGATVHGYDGAQALTGPGVFAYTRGVLTLEMTPRSTAGIFRNAFERTRP